MLGRRDGLTLVELMVVMSIVMFVITAASRMMASFIVQFKQQSSIAQSGIETSMGLELLRRDIFTAGYGLPTEFEAPIEYDEALDGTNPANFNDAPSGVPRPIVATNPGFATLNDSDYLVIKSTAVDEIPTAGKWHYLLSDGTRSSYGTDSPKNLADTDSVVVIHPKADKEDTRILVVQGSNWYTTFDATSYFVPAEWYEKNIIYGVQPEATGEIRAPFNRADYYISGENVPGRCAGADLDPPITGVLVKRVFDHSTGGLGPEIPLMECVADMQVLLLDYYEDASGNLTIDVRDGTDGLSAKDITSGGVDDVRVYLLAHEGRLDPGYEHPADSTVITVGEFGSGRSFNLAELGETSRWNRYRWKVYTLTEKPLNLR